MPNYQIISLLHYRDLQAARHTGYLYPVAALKALLLQPLAAEQQAGEDDAVCLVAPAAQVVFVAHLEGACGCCGCVECCHSLVFFVYPAKQAPVPGVSYMVRLYVTGGTCVKNIVFYSL